MRVFLRNLLGGLAAFLLLPAALLGLDPTKSIFQFNCKNWTRTSGLPADRISAMVQDKKGYIWLGTQNGLVRYDGQTFTLVPVDLPSARGTNVASLGLAQDGTLWFRIYQGGFGGFDGEKFVRFGGENWSDQAESTALMIDRDGSTLWMGTVSGWATWTPGGPEITLQPITTAMTLAEDPSGRVWLGTTMNGLYFSENGVVTEFPDDRLKTTNIHAITRGADNDLWVGTNTGLFQYDSELRPKAVHYPGAQTTSLLVDRHGVLWIGTSGTGLLRYHKGVFTRLGKLQGFGSDAITSLLEDDEGSLWVGTTDGVSQLSDLKFPIFSSTEGLTEGSATSVAASPAGGLWIGTNTGASYLNGEYVKNITDRSLLENPYVRRIFVARNGDVYLGDGSRNLVVVRNDEVIARFSNEYWPEAFLDDGDGVIVGFGPLLVRIEGTRSEPYKFDGPGPDFGWINNLTRASDGAIWAATNTGLFRIVGGKFEGWSQTDGLPAGRVHCVVSDGDGGVWCGMPAGLLRVTKGRTTLIGVGEGLSDARIFAIVPDDLGSFWLFSGRGILRVSRANLEAFADGKVSRIECTSFDSLESIKVVDRTDQGYSGCRTADGRIWFPTPHGVVMIDPDNYFVNKVAPRVRIDRVRVGDRDVSERESTQLAANNNVEFFFTALSYIAPGKTQIRHRLEGFDRDWIDGSGRRSASYHNLPAGKYVFRIKAANADGVWSAEKSAFAITFPPPFYVRWWFLALCGLTTTFGLYGGYQMKVRRLRQHQRRLQTENDILEAKVGARTDELASSVSLLQATLDSTADGILAVKYSGEVVSHNLQFERMWRLPEGMAPVATASELNQFLSTQVKDSHGFITRLREVRSSKEDEAFDVIELNDGRILERYCRPQWMHGARVGIVMNYRDITQRKQSEARLKQAHQQLLETSRQAGMAEVATSVLHNVGNVLNSVNVSANLVTDKVRESKIAYVTRVADLLESNSADLATFLTQDPKGRKLVSYVSNLSVALEAEQKSLTTELAHLSKNVEHIKEIVAMQQSFACVSGVCETVASKDLVEDAIRMNHTALARHEVEIVRDFAAAPEISVDRHKVMQILVNLISNAKDACRDSRREPKAITIRTGTFANGVRFSVTDNGVGIAPENLTRIFAHGFTTKKDGHGFGLHSAALTANELGGSLSAESNGVGQGATFILDLPLAPGNKAGAVTDEARMSEAKRS